MKFLNKLGLLALFAFAMSACVDQDPEIQNFPDPDVDFTYEVAGDQYTLDYYVVSPIQFKNTSAKTGTVTWNFGCDENLIEIQDNNPMAPVVKYKQAGRYDVTLTIDGVGSRTYPILIYDIVPIPSISKVEVGAEPSELVLLNDASVSFALRLPNPENKVVKYTWTFPEGAKDASGALITQPMTFTTDPETGAVECPQNVTFSNLGSQQVTVDAVFDLGSEDERALDQSYINVQVASPIEAPTLYYAQVGGNIKAVKLLSDEQLASMGNPKVFPYDMGVSAGENPFNILYGSTVETNEETGETGTGHWIYILDAGKQYYYINDEGGVLGDGKITAMRADGTGVNTVISNVGGAAFNDPFQGAIYDGYIYYNDRNQGFSKVAMTERGLTQGIVNSGGTILRDSYVAKNDLIPYYNRGIAYGAISTGLYRDKAGIWWWGKNYSGNGIYRFKDSDIYTTAAAAAAAAKPYPTVLESIKFTSYILDEDRGKLYIWGIAGSGKGAGFVEYALPAADATVGVAAATGYVNMEAKPVNTTADEQVFVKQLVVDSRDGRVYFGFRAEEGDAWSAAGNGHTGLVYYDPETQKCQNYGETSDEILGVTINPTATKLF